MVFVDDCIVVLRNPTPAYEKHIVVCRADGVAIDILSCEIFDDLIEANLVQQDHCENETKIIFKLTDYGRKISKSKTYQPWLSVAGKSRSEEHRLSGGRNKNNRTCGVMLRHALPAPEFKPQQGRI